MECDLLFCWKGYDKRNECPEDERVYQKMSFPVYQILVILNHYHPFIVLLLCGKLLISVSSSLSGFIYVVCAVISSGNDFQHPPTKYEDMWFDIPESDSH